MKKKGPPGYSDEFRRNALQLAARGDKPLTQLARELRIHLETLRNWRRQAKRAGGAADEGTVLTLEEENRRLRRENERLREEREILKKATAFFAKDAR